MNNDKEHQFELLVRQHKRGLSDELVCLLCAVGRKGKAVAKVAKLGKCSSAAVEAVRRGHALHGRRHLVPQLLQGQRQRPCADQRGGGSVNGICHIQHLNAYHLRQKASHASFRGVSTKYIDNYLT